MGPQRNAFACARQASFVECDQERTIQRWQVHESEHKLIARAHGWHRRYRNGIVFPGEIRKTNFAGHQRIQYRAEKYWQRLTRDLECGSQCTERNDDAFPSKSNES